MVKKSMRVIIVMLCAVMVVFCTLTACNSNSPSKLNPLSATQLLDNIEDVFPNAHIGNIPNSGNTTILFFYKNESNSPYFKIHKGYEEGIAYSTYSFNLCNLTSEEDTVKILDSIMPNYISDWNSNNTRQFFSQSQPNRDFTEWVNNLRPYDINEWSLTPFNRNTDGEHELIIRVLYHS